MAGFVVTSKMSWIEYLSRLSRENDIPKLHIVVDQYGPDDSIDTVYQNIEALCDDGPEFATPCKTNVKPTKRTVIEYEAMPIDIGVNALDEKRAKELLAYTHTLYRELKNL